MNNAALAESTVSIAIHLYTGILQGIPNFLDMLTESKGSSYYHDILARDIEFTENAVTIAADDMSVRLLEIKLQEKGIPYDKMPSSLFEGNVKANGRHIFILREMDYGRAMEAAQDIKNGLSLNNPDVEIELGEEPERERDPPEPEAETGQEGSAVPDTGPEEEAEGGIQDATGEKEKKKKQSGLRQRVPDTQHANVREPQYDGQREKDHRDTLGPEGSGLAYGQRSEGRPDWGSDKKTSHQGTDEPPSGHRHRAERGDSQAGSADKSLNLNTGQIDRGKTTEETLQEENWVMGTPGQQGARVPHKTQGPKKQVGQQVDPLPEGDALGPGRPGQRYPGISVIGTGSDIGTAGRGQSASASNRIGAAVSVGTISRQSEIFASRAAGQKPSETNARSPNSPRFPNSPMTLNRFVETSKPASSDSAPASDPPARRTVTVQCIDRNTSGDAGHRNKSIGPAQISKGRHPDNDKEFKSGGHIYKGPRPEGHNFEGKAQTTTGQTQTAIGQAQNLQHFDKTAQILAARRLYQLRDTLSPKNFRNAIRGSKRVAVQSIIGRDTDGGRIADEAVDYVSPAAKLLKTKFLNSGAIEIARNSHCNMDVLAAAYAVKNNMSLNEAKTGLRTLGKLDAKLLKDGKGGLNLNNDGAVMEKLAEAYQIQGQPMGFIAMLRGFDDGKFAEFLGNLKITDGLRDALLKVPVKDLDLLAIDSMLKKYGGGLHDKEFLTMVRAGKLMGQYPGSGSVQALFRCYLTKMLKEIGRGSDAGRALGAWMATSRDVYSAYRAGTRLLYTALRKFTAIDVNSLAAQAIADPGKTLGQLALSKVKSSTGKSVSKFGMSAKSAIKTKRAAQHASSALKLLKNPMAPLKNLLAKNTVVKKIGTALPKLSPKFFTAAAKASAALGWAAAILVVAVLLAESFATMPGPDPDLNEKGMSNYMFVQDTEIMREIITELTAKNEAFIADINNAANHRGSYGSMAGLTANENVGFYETGAYNIVFRDAYGNELEPSHVDLNNTKAILGMATKFMPYPFQVLSESATDEEKKAYEDIKQHYKDYCYFLWASTHQITIEEYHPGNSGGIAGAIDNSGLATTFDKGKCGQDGKTIWLTGNFAPDIASGHICETCSQVPATGLGAYYDDLCTHGKEGNGHGGWRKTGNKRAGVNCRAAARGALHHGRCDHDNGEYNCYTCSLSDYKQSCSHWEYEWVYECGGHMGSVVYVTIGDLSRMPGFAAASDVDYGAVGEYGAGSSVREGETAQNKG